MNALVKEKETPLQILDKIQYKAPFKHFDPRSYDAFYSKHTHPLQYLEAIGMEIITDLLLNQFSPKQIATALQISQHILMRWIDNDAERKAEWEWALNHEADNLMFEARDKLEEVFVPSDKQLDKAEKIANHKRIMAKGFGQKRWGQKVDVSGIAAGATVTYNFNVGLLPEQQERLVREKASVIEHKGDPNPPVSFDFTNYLGSGLNAIDLTIPKEDMNYEEAKAQETPLFEPEQEPQG
jgi:hypothetical protein